MKKTSTILLLSSLFIFLGCSDSSKEQSKEIKIKRV